LGSGEGDGVKSPFPDSPVEARSVGLPDKRIWRGTWPVTSKEEVIVATAESLVSLGLLKNGVKQDA